MSMFVHLGDARRAQSYRRSGLKVSRSRGVSATGIYAMPVLPSYFASHQWLRELKRSGMKELVGVYFRIPDAEPVVVGHYNQAHVPMTAAKAVGFLMSQSDPQGYEVIVPRAVDASEIHAVRRVSQVVGWRYFPGAHGKRPCACLVCIPRGAIKSKRLRAAMESSLGIMKGSQEAG